MKRWFTLLGGCLVAISMVMAADQPLKRLTSVQLAQMRLSDLTETSVQKSVLDRNTGGNLQSRLESQEPVVTQKAKLSALEGVAPIRMSGHNSAALQKVLKQSLSKKTTVASTWQDEGNYDISWYNTSQRNFVLTTPAQLAGLSQLVSLGYYFFDCVVELGADMDMSAHEWIPIGTNSRPYSGTFDGGGHTISGMRISYCENAGLFGYTTAAKICNVMLSSDCEINGHISGSLVGTADSGTIENCLSEATVSGYKAGGLVGNAEMTTIRLCVFNGSMPSSGWESQFRGTALMEDGGSYSIEMDISYSQSDDNSVTIGFLGNADFKFYIPGIIKDELLYIPVPQHIATVEGGDFFLMGVDDNNNILDEGEFIGSLSDDQNTLSITAEQGIDFVILYDEPSDGYLYPVEWFVLPVSLERINSASPLAYSGGVDYKNCYYRDDCAAIVSSKYGVAKTADEMKSSALINELNEAVAEVSESTPQVELNLWAVGNSGPVLSAETYKAAFWWTEGNYDTSWYNEDQDNFVLTTSAQLAGLSRLVADGVSFSYKTIRLGADMDLSAFKWVPIGQNLSSSFAGLFDGGGHKIGGLHTATAQQGNSGLFGAVMNADIRNLILSSTCRLSGDVVGSIVGQLNNSSIMNCRSDATVEGPTAGGLVGISQNSSLLASFFNGQVLSQAIVNEWNGTYLATASSPFAGEEDIVWEFDMSIMAKANSNECSITWTSERNSTSCVATCRLGEDGKLYIPQGQQIGTYGAYNLILEGANSSDGEFVGTLSDDKTTITFTNSNSSDLYMIITIYQNGSLMGYFDGYKLPFEAVRQEGSVLLGGLAGREDKTFIENSYYRQGCLPDGFVDTDRALAQDVLLSASSVTSLNTSVTEIVSSDPYIESLNRWQMGTNGPELSQEKEIASNWWTSEGNYDISWYDESQNEFSLSTPAQLAGLAYLVNSGHNFLEKTVTLANDIDLTGHLWTPIGRNSRKEGAITSFDGIFDGDGYSIHNMKVNLKTYTSTHGAFTFLGGFLGYSNGTIRNITLAEDCSVYAASSSQYPYIGGICGLFGGMQMDNCHNRASVEGKSLYSDTFVAGVLGFDNAHKPVYNSSNTGRITAESDFGEVLFVSGLVAVNARVLNSYNTGDVSGKGAMVYVGGIAAQYGQLCNVYHSGSLVATGVSEDPEVQPQVTVSPLTDNSGSSVEYGYYNVACVADTTGLNAKGVGMQAAEMKKADFAALLTENAATLMSNDPELPALFSWEIQANENSGYPVFGDAIETGGWWTSEGNYDISWYDGSLSGFELSTPAQLAGLAYLVKNGNTFEGKTVSLTNNIDLAGLKWEAIGTESVAFMGAFDGGGYEIHNLHCEIASADLAIAGLFGNVSQATLSNIVLADDCFVKTSGFCYTAGIVAYANESEIYACLNYAAVNIEAPLGYAGGIVGYTSVSSVRECENYGVVTADVKNTGTNIYYYVYAGGVSGLVSGSIVDGIQRTSLILNNSNHAEVIVHDILDRGSYVGGIVGYFSGPVAVWNNYNTANVTLDGAGCAGGILGYNEINESEIKNCYNVGTVSTTAGTVAPIAPILYGEVNNLFYLSTCVAEADEYMGTALSAGEMKSESFAALLNNEVNAHNALYDTRYGLLYWKVDAQLNDGYPVFTDEDPGYSAVESAKVDVRIYPTAVSGTLYVSGAEEPVYIYNLAGHTVSVTEAVEGTTAIDMSGLAKGVYLVRTGDRVERVIKL